jgi:hypothetical protein
MDLSKTLDAIWILATDGMVLLGEIDSRADVVLPKDLKVRLTAIIQRDEALRIL